MDASLRQLWKWISVANKQTTWIYIPICEFNFSFFCFDSIPVLKKTKNQMNRYHSRLKKKLHIYKKNVDILMFKIDCVFAMDLICTNTDACILLNKDV